MNCVSLDSVGIAGFSHTFGSLDGHQSEVALLEPGNLNVEEVLMPIKEYYIPV